jgi:hypothetical protein
MIDKVSIPYKPIAQQGTPEGGVNRIALRRDHNRHLLEGCTIRGRTVLSRDSRHGPRELDVSRFKLHESG